MSSPQESTNRTSSRTKLRGDLPEAILATLRYSDYFNFPLTFAELQSRLVKKASPALLQKQLKQMLNDNLVQYDNGFYYLPHRKKLLSLRAAQARSSAKLYERAQVLATRLSHFPGVLAIYLTGSLALRNTADGDIDFMVITQVGRLWLTRLLLTLYTSLSGLRRTPHSFNNSGKLCLNLYLTPHSFVLPESKRSLYTAYELIQAVPLADPAHTHPALLAANSWVHDYLPNFLFPASSTIPDCRRPNLFIQALEATAYRLQYLYMRPKITRELVTPEVAFFHPQDPGEKVLSQISR